MTQESAESPQSQTAAYSPLFNADRHRLIARLAEKALTDKAREAIKPLLARVGAISLEEVATWADVIKDFQRFPKKMPTDRETQDFLSDKRNDVQRKWHFLDLPLDATYDPTKYADFITPLAGNEVVAKTCEALAVLPKQSDRFSEPNALRLVVHYLGDLHQPLHVGCGYVDDSKTPPELIRDHVHAKGHHSDRGGNKILPVDSSQVLHAIWDGTINRSSMTADA